MSDIICVTNRSLCAGDFFERLDALAACRPRGIILREKDLTEAEYRALAARAREICARHGTACILHSYHGAAAELGAGAIHLPMPVLRDMSAEQKSHFRLIGASCHSPGEALEAQSLGCGYITAGHIFETDCKKGLPGRGTRLLAEICGKVSIPVYAIGGIGPENVNRARAAGAAGVCVMSGAMKSPDAAAYLGMLAAPGEAPPKPFAIFDMDGTLIDSLKYWEGLGREYLTRRGVTDDLEETLRDIDTMTVSEAAELFVRRHLPGVTARDAAEDMNRMMDGHYRRDIPAKSRVPELLRRLKAAGVRMCVVSATHEELIHACLDRLGLLDFFDFVLSCESLGTHKREPLIYREAAARLGADTGDAAVYEDALYAIETAKKAGFYTVAVYEKANAGQWPQICSFADETVNLD